MHQRVFSLLLLSLAGVLGAIPGIMQANRETFPGDLVGLNLVEFFSPNCYHCLRYKEVLRKVSLYIQENQNQLYGMKLQQFNCKGGSHCHRLKLNALPTIRLYLGSTLLGTVEGTARIDYIISWILKTIDSNTDLIARSRPQLQQIASEESELGALPPQPEDQEHQLGYRPSVTGRTVSVSSSMTTTLTAIHITTSMMITVKPTPMPQRTPSPIVTVKTIAPTISTTRPTSTVSVTPQATPTQSQILGTTPKYTTAPPTSASSTPRTTATTMMHVTPRPVPPPSSASLATPRPTITAVGPPLLSPKLIAKAPILPLVVA